MNEKILFCIIGILALGFCIFTTVDTIRLKMEHKVRGTVSILFCIAGILLLSVILIGELI